MRKGNFRKGLVIAVIVLFIGACIVPSISGNNKIIKYMGDIKTNNNYNLQSIESEIILEWTTATETNNSGFEIERKSEAQDWLKIGFVPGHGTTTEKQNYRFTDRPEDSGEYVYRLKQIDFDGSFEYSDEVKTEYSPTLTFMLEQNYPNPFNPTTTIKFTVPERQLVSLQVFNALGEMVDELVNSEREAGSYEIKYNADRLPSGIYFYTLTSGEYNETNKMILLR